MGGVCVHPPTLAHRYQICSVPITDSASVSVAAIICDDQLPMIIWACCHISLQLTRERLAGFHQQPSMAYWHRLWRTGIVYGVLASSMAYWHRLWRTGVVYGVLASSMAYWHRLWRTGIVYGVLASSMAYWHRLWRTGIVYGVLASSMAYWHRLQSGCVGCTSCDILMIQTDVRLVWALGSGSGLDFMATGLDFGVTVIVGFRIRLRVRFSSYG